MDMTEALLIVAAMIATTGFGALGALYWWSRREDRAFFRRELEQRDR